MVEDPHFLLYFVRSASCSLESRSASRWGVAQAQDSGRSVQWLHKTCSLEQEGMHLSGRISIAILWAV